MTQKSRFKSQTLLNDDLKMLCCANLNGDSPTNNTTKSDSGSKHNRVVCWTVTQWTPQDLSCDIKMCNLLCKLNFSWTTGVRGRKETAPFPWQCQSPGRTCTEREKSRKVQWFLGSESITLAALLQQQSCSSSCRWQLELCGNLVKSLSFWLMQGRYKIWIRIFYLESLFQKALIVKAPSLGSLTVCRSRAILLSENCYQYGMAIFSHITTSQLGFQPYYFIPHYD